MRSGKESASTRYTAAADCIKPADEGFVDERLAACDDAGNAVLGSLLEGPDVVWSVDNFLDCCRLQFFVGCFEDLRVAVAGWQRHVGERAEWYEMHATVFAALVQNEQGDRTRAAVIRKDASRLVYRGDGDIVGAGVLASVDD